VSESQGEVPTQTRVCPRCSVQSKAPGDFCPNCGKAYARRRPSRRTHWIILGVVVALIVIAGGTALVLMVRHGNEVEAAEAAAAKEAEEAEALEAKQAKRQADARAAKRASDKLERQTRRLVVKELQKSITKDAREKVNDGLLDGPILNTQCTPVGGGSTDDLTAITGKFECLAVNKNNGDGTVSGYSFAATVDWKKFSYTWQLGG